MNRYQRAKLRADAAQHLFDAVTRAYRHREIGDAEYLAARKRHDAAQAEFDTAFSLEDADQRARLGLTTTTSGLRKLREEANAPMVTGGVVDGWENVNISSRTTTRTMRRLSRRQVK